MAAWGGDDTTVSETILDPTMPDYRDTLDQILDETDPILEDLKSPPSIHLALGSAHCEGKGVSYFPLALRTLFHNSEILNTQQRLFKLLQHSRMLTENELALGDQVDSNQVSEFTFGEEQLSFWQTLKAMVT